jgi:hypothetical protein
VTESEKMLRAVADRAWEIAKELEAYWHEQPVSAVYVRGLRSLPEYIEELKSLSTRIHAVAAVVGGAS